MPFLKAAIIREQKEQEKQEIEIQQITSKLSEKTKAEARQKKQTNINVGKLYECYIGSIYEQYNWTVEYNGINKGVHDKGIDLICRKDDKTVVVQCKCYKTSYVLVKDIYQFYGAFRHYAIKHPQERVSATFWTSQNEYRKICEAFKAAVDLGIRFYSGRKMPVDFTSPIVDRVLYLPFDKEETA